MLFSAPHCEKTPIPISDTDLPIITSSNALHCMNAYCFIVFTEFETVIDFMLIHHINAKSPMVVSALSNSVTFVKLSHEEKA